MFKLDSRINLDECRDPYIVTDEGIGNYGRVQSCSPQKIVHSFEDDEGTLFVSATENPYLFRYGYRQKKADCDGNPAGYVWSSRPGCLNQQFGTDYMTVLHQSDGTLVASAKVIETLLPEGYYINRYERNGEITYYIKKGIKTNG